MWLADMVIAFPVNSSQLRLIRLARLLRLVRLVRVVRGFDSLIVMTTALQESATYQQLLEKCWWSMTEDGYVALTFRILSQCSL